MKKVFVSFILSFLLPSLWEGLGVGSLHAQTTVLSYRPGVTTDGVVYYLPQTALKIAVTATRTTVHPGDFHNYAQRMLRLNDAAQKEQTQWKIDKVQMVACGEPDTAKAHIVMLKKNTSAPLCSLTEDGILLSINAQSEQPKEAALELLNSSTTGKVNSRDFFNEEILSAGSELKMAELTAAEIYNIRESRSELTKGEADYMPKDGEQLKLMLQKLDEQEHALMQLFKGYADTETKTWVLTYVPSIAKDKEVIARFSDQHGLVDKDNLSGEPIYITVLNKKTVAEGKTEITDKRLIDRVVYYNVPSQAEMEISFMGTALIKSQMPIAQFGHEEYLTDDLFNRRATCHIWFSPVTGNIQKIEDTSVGK